MALTLEAEQRLDAVDLIDLFTNHQADWTAAAQRAYDFVEQSFPTGATIRPDDVAKVLEPMLAVDSRLTDALATKRLKQKFWVSYFTDLIIDRVWQQIS